ncbi:MAG: hypothetical protein AB2A00_15305 [Myxococcota bacterium]
MRGFLLMTTLVPLLTACPLPGGYCERDSDCAAALQKCDLRARACRNVGGVPTPGIPPGASSGAGTTTSSSGDDGSCEPMNNPGDMCPGAVVNVGAESRCKEWTGPLSSLSGVAVGSRCGMTLVGADGILHVIKQNAGRVTIDVDPSSTDAFLQVIPDKAVGGDNRECLFGDAVECIDTSREGGGEHFSESDVNPTGLWVRMGFKDAVGEATVRVRFHPP